MLCFSRKPPAGDIDVAVDGEPKIVGHYDFDLGNLWRRNGFDLCVN